MMLASIQGLRCFTCIIKPQESMDPSLFQNTDWMDMLSCFAFYFNLHYTNSDKIYKSKKKQVPKLLSSVCIERLMYTLKADHN